MKKVPTSEKYERRGIDLYRDIPRWRARKCQFGMKDVNIWHIWLSCPNAVSLLLEAKDIRDWGCTTAAEGVNRSVLSVDGSGSIIGTISQKPVVFDHLFWDNFVQAHTTSCILLECHHAKAALAFSQAMAGDGHTPTSGKPLGRIAFEIQHVQTHPPNLFLGGGHFRQLLFFFERGGNCRFFCGRRFLRRSQIWLGIHMKLWWILFTLQTYLPWKP